MFGRSKWSMFIMAKDEQSISRFGFKAYKIHYIYKCNNTCTKKTPILATYHTIFRRKSKSQS